MKFPHRAEFTHIVCAKDVELKKQISSASISELKNSLIPFHVNLDVNADLIGIAFDAAVVNMFNSNGDGISSATAIRLMPSYLHKPINIEHERDDVVGHILSAAFTERTFHKTLDLQTIQDTLQPFHLSLGGVVYRIVDKGLASLLQDIAEGEERQEVVSASWELGFTKYSAAICATDSRMLKDCTVISDPEEVEKLSKHMKCYGGSGILPDKTYVYRLIDDPGALFLGIGLTSSPAAKVSGVFVFNSDDLSDLTVPPSGEPLESDSKKSEEIISQNKEDDVIIIDSGETMNKEEILAMIKEAVASEKKEESVANIAKTIADAIVQQNEVFKNDVTQAEVKAAKLQEEAEAAKQKLLNIEKSVAETQEALKLANEKINAFETEKAVAEAKESFNRRMSAIDEEFELSDSDREVIAKRVSAFASEEEFVEYQNEIKVLMSSKLKTKIEEAKAASAAAVKSALAEELKRLGIKDPLDGKTPEEVAIANNSAAGSAGEKSLRERFAGGFSDKKVTATI